MKLINSLLILACFVVLAQPVATGQNLAGQLSQLRAVVDQDPGKPRPDKKTLEQSIKTLDAIIEKDHSNWEAYYIRAVAYMKLGNGPKSCADFNATLKLNPRQGKSYWCRGVLLFSDKTMKQALSDFDAAIENGSDSAAVYANRGAAYLRLGQKHKALEDFDRCLEKAPGQSATRLMRAELHRSLANYGLAIEDCDAIIADKKALPRDLPDCYKIRGSCLFQLGRYKEATESLTKAMEGLDNKGKARAVYIRGLAYAKLGKKETATTDLQLARKLGFVTSVNITPDKQVDEKTNSSLDAAIKPLIAQAQKTLPQVKERYLRGLGQYDLLFVTYRLYDATRGEHVFVEVHSWNGDKITGTISSEVKFLNRRAGEQVIVPEKDVLDWTITHPDGSEEGNIVGKFLDNWKG